jgi:hypothetical protein
MGRTLKQRKLKNVKRLRLKRFKETAKPKKQMKRWEWWLLGAAFVFAFGYIIFLAKSNSLTPTPQTTPGATTPVSTITATQK